MATVEWTETVRKHGHELCLKVHKKVHRFCEEVNISGYADGSEMISTSIFDGRCNLTMSSCLPSNYGKAEAVVILYGMIMEKTNELMVNENSQPKI